MNRLRTYGLLFGCLCAASYAVACGDDEDGGGPSDDGGTDASAGSSGTGGGTAGRGGAGGTGGRGGAGAGGGGAGGGGTGGSTGDGGPEAGPDAGPDGGMAAISLCGGTTGQDLVDCGQYIVDHVAVCPDCHTPRDAMGAPVAGMKLAGNPSFIDFDPTSDTVGLLPTPNLTQLGAWSDDEIKNAILNGVRPGGEGLFPIMPYYVFHNMAAEDADAIVAYLRSLTPITNVIPARQPTPFPSPTLPIAPVPAASIPDSQLATTNANYAAAQRGKYIAGNIGVCMECHTQRVTGTFTLDTSKLFQGGEEFQRDALGLPPFFPASIYSRNITPDVQTGIGGWTATMVRDALKLGVDDDGLPLCPPMPAGPMQAFGGLTDEDALAIGHYLTSLAAATNPASGTRFPECVPIPPGDGGPPADSGADSGP